MILKLIHKYQDGGHRIIDAEKDDAKEFLQQYILENKGNSGTVELFVKDSKGEYTKVEESIVGNRK